MKLDVRWRPYCLEIRDDYDVAPAVSADRRDLVLAAHLQSHHMLRVIEAARCWVGRRSRRAALRGVGKAILRNR